MTGGPDGRSIIYFARRRLHMSRAEWESTPWPEQRTLLEGWKLEQEANARAAEGDEESDKPTRTTTTQGSGEDAVAALLG